MNWLRRPLPILGFKFWSFDPSGFCGDVIQVNPLVAEISWTHNLIILEKCKDDLEQEFYIRMTRK